MMKKKEKKRKSFLGYSELWSFIIMAIIIIEQQAIISALYCVMTCGLLRGQYGGDHCICQSASNLLNITYN